MKHTLYSKRYLFTAICCCCIIACSKVHDTYSDFIKDGEIYYPGRADSLKAFPGENRILLQWLLVSDPKITKTKVYWNNKADSTEIPVTRSAGTDTIKTMLLPMNEGTYTFEVYTYDTKGNRSVKVEKIANVYGYNYAITLVNRAVKTAKMNTTNDTANVEWYKTSLQHVGVDLRYKNKLGDSVFVSIAPDAIQKKLPGFVKGQSFKFRSLYKPEENAIDTFYSAFEYWTIQ